jgi:hypothetical protein
MPANSYAAPKTPPDKSTLPSGLTLRNMWVKLDLSNPYPTLSTIIHDPTNATPTTNPDIILAANVKTFRYTNPKVDDGKTQLTATGIWLLNENHALIKACNNFLEAQIDRNNHYLAVGFRFQGKGVDPDKGEEREMYARLENFENNFDSDSPGYTFTLLGQPSAWNFSESVLT